MRRLPCNNNITVLFVGIALAGLIVVAREANAAPSSCRSERGGYCVQLPSPPPPPLPPSLASRLLAQTKIPGLEFLNTTVNSTLGEVINETYRFGLSIVGISSLIMFVFGAAMYMFTSFDSAQKASKGKEFMSNAIWGLVIALTSWLLLYTINPQLVTVGFNVANLTP